MRAKMLTGAMLVLLVAAAFFLPERLLIWGDGTLLDSVQMDSRTEAREGLAESIQLTVPEKVMLLRSGTLTVVELDQTELRFITFQAFGPAAAGGGETPLLIGADDAERAYAEEVERLWRERLDAVQGELRALQAAGGLPDIWRPDQMPDCLLQGDLLYLDPGTQMSFQVYQMSLYWTDCALELLVDDQSGRILSLTLYWHQDSGTLQWGSRGASGFGSAWRDYWRMDSVSTGWYNDHTRNILEDLPAQAAWNGDYASYDQITFMYDTQSLSIPLECQSSRSQFLIAWNR